MSWLMKFCRHAGLTIHHIVKPLRTDTRTRQVRHEVEEKKVSPTVTLRRTTIEEIEVKREPDDAGRG